MNPSPAAPGVAAGIAVPLPILPTPATSPQAPSLRALLVVAVAYFALGVATGALVRRLESVRTLLLIVLVVPGVLIGLGYLGWIAYTLR